MLNGLSGGLPEYGLTQPIILTYANKNDLSGEVTDNHKKEDQESVDYEPFLGLAGTQSIKGSDLGLNKDDEKNAADFHSIVPSSEYS